MGSWVWEVSTSDSKGGRRGGASGETSRRAESRGCALAAAVPRDLGTRCRARLAPLRALPGPPADPDRVARSLGQPVSAAARPPFLRAGLSAAPSWVLGQRCPLTSARPLGRAGEGWGP